MFEDLNQLGSIDLWLENIHAIIGRETSKLCLLDLCCGEMTASQRLTFAESLHVDLNNCPNRPANFLFYQCDVLNFDSGGLVWDVAICSDGLEHFRVKEGKLLLDHMEQWAALPIIFTPTGEPADNLDPTSKDPDRHKSSWTPEMFHRRGWRTRVYPNWHPTIGLGAMFAWKPLSK